MAQGCDHVRIDGLATSEKRPSPGTWYPGDAARSPRRWTRICVRPIAAAADVRGDLVALDRAARRADVSRARSPRTPIGCCATARSMSPCWSARRTSSASTASRSTPRGGFETPLGVAPIDEACARRDCSTPRRSSASIQRRTSREHSLEMQLPFLAPRARGADRPAADGLPDARPRRTLLGDALAVGAARPPRAARREHRSLALPRRGHRRRARCRRHRLRVAVRRRGAAARARCATRSTPAAAARRSR